MLNNVPPGLLWSILVAVVGAALYLGQQQGAMSQKLLHQERQILTLQEQSKTLIRLSTDVEYIKERIDFLAKTYGNTPLYGDGEPR
jgi:hypothetical protein